MWPVKSLNNLIRDRSLVIFSQGNSAKRWYSQDLGNVFLRIIHFECGFTGPDLGKVLINGEVEEGEIRGLVDSRNNHYF